MKNLFFYQTEIGEIAIAEYNNTITNLFLPGKPVPGNTVISETKLLKEAGEQLQTYLAGERQVFTLPLAPLGTDFMQRVWASLCAIPYGATRSYQQVAHSIGNPKAARAVGQANNKNPIPIFIPCHRVIGANGKMVGYGGGLHIKNHLLELEKRHGLL